VLVGWTNDLASRADSAHGTPPSHLMGPHTQVQSGCSSDGRMTSPAALTRLTSRSSTRSAALSPITTDRCACATRSSAWTSVYTRTHRSNPRPTHHHRTPPPPHHHRHTRHTRHTTTATLTPSSKPCRNLSRGAVAVSCAARVVLESWQSRTVRSGGSTIRRRTSAPRTSSHRVVSSTSHLPSSHPSRMHTAIPSPHRVRSSHCCNVSSPLHNCPVHTYLAFPPIPSRAATSSLHTHHIHTDLALFTPLPSRAATSSTVIGSRVTRRDGSCAIICGRSTRRTRAVRPPGTRTRRHAPTAHTPWDPTLTPHGTPPSHPTWDPHEEACTDRSHSARTLHAIRALFSLRRVH
jgi:hypothetical protein